jgi:hypothetical protein
MDFHETGPGLGIDFGGVIVTQDMPETGEDTAFVASDPDGYLLQMPVTDCVETIKELVDIFAGRVWIVSKAGARMEDRTRRWLDYHNFCEKTGLLTQHIRFCRERLQKRDICLEAGITHFVDDRVHVMQILQGAVKHLYLFCPEAKRSGRSKHWRVVSGWTDAIAAIRESFSRELA